MKFSAVFAASAAATVIVLLAWCLGTTNAWLTNPLNGIGHFSRRQVFRMSGVHHSRPNPPLDATWEPVNLPEYPAVQKYLSREATAVALPGKVGQDRHLPGLIIDGGPGVGKTQQAFALLKDGKHKLVYLLLTDTYSVRRKSINREMIDITSMGDFLQVVDAARAAVVANAGERCKDPFGVSYLSYFTVNINHIPPLNDLIQFMADRVLHYEEGRNILSRTIRKTRGKRTVDDPNDRLSGAVLFLDEVLPTPTSTEELEEAISRLHFVRSLGRSLKMQVVMVGSMAISAKWNTLQKVDPKYDQQASRRGHVECGWMDIEFIWNSVKLPALLGPDIYTNHKERPYLVGLLEDMPDDCRGSEEDMLSHLAYKIGRLSDEAKLIWLSGCWLASTSQLPPSPFAMGPADLVKGHFFEPAVAISEQNNVYMGLGEAQLQRITGPLRMVLHRYEDDNDNFWWFLASDCKQAGLSPDYGGIESALSHCVQSCLATEPVLAVALSICHEVGAEEFREAFSKLRKQSVQQRTIGPSGGSLNDYFMFAAIQMTSRNVQGGFPSTCSVVDMTKRLWEYLSPDQLRPPSGVLYKTRAYNPGFGFDSDEMLSKRTFEYSYGKEGNDDETSINDMHRNTMMPWLVPACSHQKLKEKIEETLNGKQSLFSELRIAGLVPGFNESTGVFDATAYLWECEARQCAAPLEWTFEFQRQPTGHYLMTQLCDHLESKCATLSKKFNEDNKALVDDPKFHSMLVVSTGSVKSECRIWLEDEKLRIVLLVGSQPFGLRWP